MTKGEGNREKNIYRWFIDEFFILVYQLKVTKIAGCPDNRKSGIRPYRISGLIAGIRLLEKPDIRCFSCFICIPVVFCSVFDYKIL